MRTLEPAPNGEVYIISDLHLGGRGSRTLSVGPKQNESRPDYRMCSARGYELLVDFLGMLSDEASNDSSREVLLIINGDFIDFLAEDEDDGSFYPFMDQAMASTHLRRLVQQPRVHDGCKEVFEKLKIFLSNGNARLIIILGNHDVELAWPDCEDIIANSLAPYHNRIKWIKDGEPLIVGQLWIEHGNRFDTWNKVNYKQLQKRTKGEAVRFFPAYGSELVTVVINELKKSRCFVDLLKPEKRTVVPLLYLLTTDNRAELVAKIASIRLGLRRLQSRILPARAPAPSGPSSSKKTSSIEREPVDSERFDLEEYMGDPMSRQLLDEELMHLDGATVLEGVPATRSQTGAIDDGMGVLTLALENVDLRDYNEKAPRERLEIARSARRAFEYFLTEEEDRLNIHIEKKGLHINLFDSLIGKDNIIITGHTHILKFVEYESNLYINTGTWADIMTFPDLTSDDPDPEANEMVNFLGAVTKNDADYLRRYRSIVPSYAFIKFGQDGTVVQKELRVHRMCPAEPFSVPTNSKLRLRSLIDAYAQAAPEGSLPAPASPSASVTANAEREQN